MDYDLPEKHCAEITLIGTGGGYGESCVIHYGNNNWAVVDSCINPTSSECLPLSYLKKIGVNIVNDVKMIICTHWHNDHIMRLTNLVKECESADLLFARATDKRKFLYFMSLDYQKASEKGTISSTKEFIECLKILRERKNRIVQVGMDRILEKIPELNVTITSLSPSDYTLEQYDGEIASMIDNYGKPERKFVIESPNNKSIVLLLELGNHNAILGADLEVSDDNRKGWLNVLDYSKAVKDKKASLFKISHHGSKNGYHERIWLELLIDSPTSKLTPWNRNKSLPEAEMIKLYIEKTDKLYITAPIINNSKPIKRDKNFSKIIELFKIKLSEVKYTFGLIRSRVNIKEIDSTWETVVDGEGFLVKN